VGSGFSRKKKSCLGKLKFWVFGRDFVVEDMGSLLLALGCRSAVATATVTRSTPPGYVSSSSSSSRKHMHCVSTFVSKRSIVKLGLEVSHSRNPLTFKSIFFFIIILTILFFFYHPHHASLLFRLLIEASVVQVEGGSYR